MDLGKMTFQVIYSQCPLVFMIRHVNNERHKKVFFHLQVNIRAKIEKPRITTLENKIVSHL